MIDLTAATVNPTAREHFALEIQHESGGGCSTSWCSDNAPISLCSPVGFISLSISSHAKMLSFLF